MLPAAWEAVVSPFAVLPHLWIGVQVAGVDAGGCFFYSKDLCLAALLGAEKGFKDVFQLWEDTRPEVTFEID